MRNSHLRLSKALLQAARERAPVHCLPALQRRRTAATSLAASLMVFCLLRFARRRARAGGRRRIRGAGRGAAGAGRGLVGGGGGGAPGRHAAGAGPLRCGPPVTSSLSRSLSLSLSHTHTHTHTRTLMHPFPHLSRAPPCVDVFWRWRRRASLRASGRGQLVKRLWVVTMQATGQKTVKCSNGSSLVKRQSTGQKIVNWSTGSRLVER